MSDKQDGRLLTPEERAKYTHKLPTYDNGKYDIDGLLKAQRERTLREAGEWIRYRGKRWSKSDLSSPRAGGYCISEDDLQALKQGKLGDEK